MKSKINYQKPSMIVQENDFFDLTTNTGLSKKMEEIYLFISEIAVDGFTEMQFKDFYQNGFIRADFTYILNDNDEKIGFLFATFHRVKENGKIKYIGKAFPCVRKEYRQSGYNYDRMKLYQKFIYFYLHNITKLKFLKEGPKQFSYWVADYDSFEPSQILFFITNTVTNLNNSDDMEIRINVENPTTFADLCHFGLKTNIPWLSKSELRKLENIDETELKQQRKRNIRKKKPAYVQKADFFVNISKKEKLNSYKTTNPFKKFFILTNPKFPKFAFKVIIPVNPDNIMNAVFRTIEIMDRDKLIMFLNSVQFIMKIANNNKGVNEINRLIKNAESAEFKFSKSMRKSIKEVLGIRAI